MAVRARLLHRASIWPLKIPLRWAQFAATSAIVLQYGVMPVADSPTPSDAGGPAPAEAVAPKILSPAAQRALAEAEARRAAQAADAAKANAPTEIAGRGGLDPVRYGDWEIKGLTSDF